MNRRLETESSIPFRICSYQKFESLVQITRMHLNQRFWISIEQYPGLVIIGYCNAQLYRGPCLLKPVNPMMLTKNIR